MTSLRAWWTHSAFCQLFFLRLTSLRDREQLFFAYGLPLALASVLAFSFQPNPHPLAPILVGEGAEGDEVAAVLQRSPELIVKRASLEEARERLRTGAVQLVVTGSQPREYWMDPSRTESREARLLVHDLLERAEGRVDRSAPVIRESLEPGSRYIDFFFPGLLGFTLMSTSLTLMGSSFVGLRHGKVLKRLRGTPMRPGQLLFAWIAVRCTLGMVETGILLAFAHWVLGVPVAGSMGSLLVVTTLGLLMWSGVGLLMACRVEQHASYAGLETLVTFPQMMASGVFFSTSNFPDWIEPVLRALPLTAFVDSLRAVSVEGAGLAEVASRLLLLGVFAILSFALALRFFRWS